MKKVRVVEKDNYDYTLEDTNQKIYKVNIEFYDVTVDVGDYIYLDDKVLEEVNQYAYGPIIDKNNVEDLIKIVKDNDEIYLQRYYG